MKYLLVIVLMVGIAIGATLSYAPPKCAHDVRKTLLSSQGGIKDWCAICCQRVYFHDGEWNTLEELPAKEQEFILRYETPEYEMGK